MTKPAKTFAHEDRLIAARALWLLEGKPAGGPDASGLHRLLVVPENLPPPVPENRLPLARFAAMRYSDALVVERVPADFISTVRDVRLPAVAGHKERTASATLLDAKRLLERAQSEWRDAETAHQELFRGFALPGVTLSSGAPEEIFDLIAQALVLAQEADRKVRNYLAKERDLEHELVRRHLGPFTTLRGLSRRERSRALNIQAALLVQFGVAPEDVAFLLAGRAAVHLQRDRTRKRIARVRAALTTKCPQPTDKLGPA
jgi:hypothetical protein